MKPHGGNFMKINDLYDNPLLRVQSYLSFQERKNFAFSSVRFFNLNTAFEASLAKLPGRDNEDVLLIKEKLSKLWETIGPFAFYLHSYLISLLPTNDEEIQRRRIAIDGPGFNVNNFNSSLREIRQDRSRQIGQLAQTLSRGENIPWQRILSLPYSIIKKQVKAGVRGAVQKMGK